MFLRKSSSVDTSRTGVVSEAPTNGSRSPAKTMSSAPANGAGGNWSSVLPSNHHQRAPEDLENNDNVVVIGEGVNINCEIWNCSRVIVSGTLNGALAATEVVVRETGRLNATVYAEKADIAGLVDGKIVVMNHVGIRNGGCVSGGLVYGTLAIEPGGILTGNLRQELDDEEKSVIEGLKQGHLNAAADLSDASVAPAAPRGDNLDGPRSVNTNPISQQQTWVRSMGQTK